MRKNKSVVLSDEWLFEQAKILGLKIKYVKIRE